MITKRALIIGSICSFLIGAGEPFSVLLIQGSPMCADYSTGGALFLLFLITFFIFLLNSFFKKKKIGLSPSELITIYIMMIVSCAIPSWGFTMNLIGLIGGIFYYATATNRWEELIHPHLPKFLFPDKNALWSLYEGLPFKGEKIPYGAWIKPLFFWFIFILAIYFIGICLVVIFRKQWSEKERLIYPLTILPGEMVSSEIPFYKNPIMWLGFSIPAIIYSINGLHSLFPLFPVIQLSRRLIAFRSTFWIPIRIFFEVIGLAFLLSLDVSFSLWFFAVIAICLTGYLNIIGFSIGPVEPFSDPAPQVIAYQSLGALIVLVISSIWFARGHLKSVFKNAIGKKEIDDTEEILPYKICVWGGLLSFIFCVWFIYLTGLPFISSVFFLLIAFIIFLGLTRISAQAGLAYYRAPVIPAAVTLHTFGSKFLGDKGLVSLGLTFSWATDIRTMVMTSTANGLKLAEKFKIFGRKLFLSIIISILITLVSSAWSILTICYKYGGINLYSWQFGPGLSNFSARWVKEYILYPIGFGKAQLFFTLIGGFFMILLVIARAKFPWWPISPVGLACGLPYPIHHTWFSVFIAWLIKFLVMRYGGIKVYQKIKPFFLGLILGSFATGGIWLVISFLTGTKGISFTLT